MTTPTRSIDSNLSYHLIKDARNNPVNVQVMWNGAEVARVPVENSMFAAIRSGLMKLDTDNNGTAQKVRVKSQDMADLRQRITDVLTKIDSKIDDLNQLAALALSLKVFNPERDTKENKDAYNRSKTRTDTLNDNNKNLDKILGDQAGFDLELLNTPIDQIINSSKLDEIKSLSYSLSSLRNLYAAKADKNEIPIRTYNYVKERIDRLLTKAEAAVKAAANEDITKADPLVISTLKAVEHAPIKNWSPTVEFKSDKASFFNPSPGLKFFTFIQSIRGMPELKTLTNDLNSISQKLDPKASEEDIKNILVELDEKSKALNLPGNAKSITDLYKTYRAKTGIIDYTYSKAEKSAAYVADCVGHGDINKQEKFDEQFQKFNNDLEVLLNSPSKDLHDFQTKLAALVGKYKDAPGVAFAAWSFVKVVTLGDGSNIGLFLTLGDSASIVIKNTGGFEYVGSPENNCFNDLRGSVNDFLHAVPLETGDKIVLATDGTFDFLTKQQVVSIFSSPPPGGKTRLEQLRSTMEANAKEIKNGAGNLVKAGIKAFDPNDISNSDDISLVEMRI